MKVVTGYILTWEPSRVIVWYNYLSNQYLSLNKYKRPKLNMKIMLELF